MTPDASTDRDPAIDPETFGASLRLMLERVRLTLEDCRPSFPLFLDDDGAWYTTPDGNWAAGHWIGLLWLAAKHALTPEEGRQATEAARQSIDLMLTQRTDNIFAGMNHHYAGFYGFDIDRGNDLLEVGLRGARAMRDLYHQPARQVPIGEYVVANPAAQDPAESSFDLKHMAAVDVVHTSIPILWRAYAETGDEAFQRVAIAHTDRHIDWHIRPDGSVTQLMPFDPITGTPSGSLNPLARDESGCWARGLGWNIAGLADAYVATGDQRILSALRRSTDYYVANSPSDLVPYWDLTEVADTERDTSAAAIAAYGLLRMSRRVDPATRDLQDLGRAILVSLVTRYLVVDPASPERGAVIHGCYSHLHGVATDNELIWTDFYTAAALDHVISATAS